MPSPRFDYNHVLLQCAKGNETALQQLYHQTASTMLAYGLSVLSSPSEAEELVRETLILSWRNALGFDPGLGDGQGWLFSILRYRSHARLKQRTKPVQPDYIPSILTSKIAAEDTFLRQVSRLDQNSQKTLLMAYLQSSPYSEIAHRLRLNSNHVRSNLRGAISQLATHSPHWQNRIFDEQQLLIAEYTLGLLSGTEYQHIQQLLQQDDAAAQDSLAWEKSLISLCSVLPKNSPSEQLLWRIQTALGHDTDEHNAAAKQKSLDQSFIPPLHKADSASSLSIPEPNYDNTSGVHSASSTADDNVTLTGSEHTETAVPYATTQAGTTVIQNKHEQKNRWGLKRWFKQDEATATRSSTIKTEPSMQGLASAGATATIGNDRAQGLRSDSTTITPSPSSSKTPTTNTSAPNVLRTRQSASQNAAHSSVRSTHSTTAAVTAGSNHSPVQPNNHNPTASSAATSATDTTVTAQSASTAAKQNGINANGATAAKNGANHVSGTMVQVRSLPPKLWQGVALTCALLAIGLGAKIALTPQEAPITVIEMAPRKAAILVAPGQSSTPGWLLSIDPEGTVLLNPQVETVVDSEKSVQLWTQRPHEDHPQSLGLINPNRPVAIGVDKLGAVQVGQVFEMTLEKKGGASQSPSGPILFIGRVVTFGDAPVPLDSTSSTSSN